MKKDCTAKRGQQDDADKRVGGKEGGIQAAKIVSPDESMLIDQQCACGYHSRKGNRPKLSDQE
jgi:hypothetical protein